MSSPPTKSDKPLTPRHAWLPLTPRGVAAFAYATLTRLIIVQLIFAAIVALTVIWFLRVAWFPVVTQAAHRLPETGAIRGGELDFGGPSPQRLAENARLAIFVDVADAGTTGQAADLEVTFEKGRVTFCGALGCGSRPYDRRYISDFNRAAVEPAWGAWQWPITALAAIATVISLMVMWWVVAFLYLPLAKLLAFFANRRVTLAGAWKLSAAALLPGALIAGAGLLLYGFGTIDLFRFALVCLLHILAGLVFVVTSPFFLPAVSGFKPGKNPFSPPAPKNAPTQRTKPASPFSWRRDD